MISNERKEEAKNFGVDGCAHELYRCNVCGRTIKTSAIPVESMKHSLEGKEHSCHSGEFGVLELVDLIPKEK